MLKNENYQRHIVIGLVLTIIIWVGLTVYWINESNRLAHAAEHLAQERVELGEKVYKEQCASCHGARGEGGVGTALNNKGLLKNTQDAVFFSVIRSGVPSTEMPAWSVDYGGPLTDQDIQDVVAFIRGWEPDAPTIEPEVFEPDPVRGALLFAGTCAVCHGENGMGGDKAPAINNPDRLQTLDNDWYGATIRNGRPAKGMPTWGSVLSPEQVEDIIALLDAWRAGSQVQAAFSITDLLESAVFSLQNEDPESAALHVDRALRSAEGVGAEALRNAAAQLTVDDQAGALATLEALKKQWPMGDANLGAETYTTQCAPCHGVQGEGGIGNQLNPNEFVHSNTNADLVEFMLAGREGTAMAGFDGRLTEEEIANVLAFLRLWQTE